MSLAISIAGTCRASEANGLNFFDCPRAELAELGDLVRCGTLDVFEDRFSRRGRKIPLFFVVIRPLGDDPAPDPIFFLDGGPGLAATQSVPIDEMRAVLDLSAERDQPEPEADGALPALLEVARRFSSYEAVYVDARGTGLSNGLDCVSPLTGADGELAAVFESRPYSPARMRQCLREMRRRADLRHYTTSNIADDLNDVRTALGYERINLFGGSYGSRLGLEVVRRHGAHVRAASLSFMAPAFGSLVTTLPRDVEEVLDQVFTACATDPTCHEAFPDPRSDLHEVLTKGAVRITLENPVSGRAETVDFHRVQVVTAIRYMLYGVAQQAQLPLVLQLAARGDLTPLARHYLASRTQIDALTWDGMWASVKCSEELAFVDFAEASRIAEGTVMGRSRLDAEIEICMSWPKGDVPEDFHRPVVSDVPVLLLNGDRDPATPLRLARETARHLPNGRLVVLRNRSHLMLHEDLCYLEIQAAFLDAGSVKPLDTSCAERLELPPFATVSEDLDPSFLE